MIQRHNIDALYDENSRILILGSFPSVKSREQEFFYAHYQNRFWAVIAAVFGCEKPENIEEKRKLILSNNIALWDVIGSCEIHGSSDNSIKNAVPNDISPILEKCKIKHIFINGKTAFALYNKYLYPVTGIKAVCLPSTSAANAAYSLERLIKCWSVIVQQKF